MIAVLSLLLMIAVVALTVLPALRSQPPFRNWDAVQKALADYCCPQCGSPWALHDPLCPGGGP